jgi:hypothetical protein
METGSMPFFETLQEETASLRQELFGIPVIAGCLEGRATRAQYVAFLREAYHHVRHTVPLLMACGSRLGPGREAAREAVAHYISEEIGHEEWILDDLAACGADPEEVRRGAPGFATEVMVAYVRDYVEDRKSVR